MELIILLLPMAAISGILLTWILLFLAQRIYDGARIAIDKNGSEVKFLSGNPSEIVNTVKVIYIFNPSDMFERIVFYSLRIVYPTTWILVIWNLLRTFSSFR